MAVIDGRTWLEILSLPECRRLLASQRVGRLAIVVDGHPEIFPLNFTMDGDAVVFRTEKGAKLSALREHLDAAFEVDEVDQASRTGWSVLVVGEVEHVTAAPELKRLRALPVEPWALGEKDHWVRLKPQRISGRRIHRGSGDTLT